ncbi:MAG: sulfatase-like hydrolase/transferase, partial [Pseudomonadota bacterium]|nr:sulfatase-like hydrolase/transferase [Pseudomonadota bacterium]
QAQVPLTEKAHGLPWQLLALAPPGIQSRRERETSLRHLIRTFSALATAAFLLLPWLPGPALCAEDKRPNVILIICDDLNDYVEGCGGHPQARTPNISRLSKSGVSFTQAHCNIPICGPSRASFFTGIYPHHSLCYGFDRWDKYPVLKNSRTIMDHFRANGYHTLGTGKLMHHLVRKEWEDYGNPSDYGPFAFDGTEKLAHPDAPAPFREIGPVDGSFGPLISLAGRTTAEGKQLQWQTGGWKRARPLRVKTQDKRDRTADELNGDWAVQQLQGLASKTNGKPFFMGIGLIRPHTPLVVPQRFFDMFPLESITLPVIKPGDVDDTHARSVRGIPKNKEPNSIRTSDMGLRLFSKLVASYRSQEDALRRFIQAYLASVASADEQIGRILDVVEKSALKNNTIIILTSDHGWGMGEKDYLYK